MKGFVYFIAAETVAAVKIGFSKRHPRGRLKELQTGCPIPLKILGFVEGDLEHELHLHRTFAELKIHSEWFRLEGRLLEMVTRLAPPAKPQPDKRVICHRCGQMEVSGRAHLVGYHKMKTCRAMQFEGARK